MTYSEETYEFAALVKKGITRRLEDKVRWYVERGSIGDRKQILDLAAKDERERLENMAAKFETEGEDTKAEAVLAIIDEWLPELVHGLKQRR